MPSASQSFSAPISTPCVGICRLDARGVCEGCLRTLDEIAQWRWLSEAERLRLMRDVLPTRKEAP